MANDRSTENPYEVPRTLLGPSVVLATSSATRILANRCLRYSLLYLLIPAAFNVAYFNREAFAGWPNPFISMLYQMTNWFWVLVIGLLIWFFGLAMLESITGIIHRCCSRRQTRESWNAALYATLQSAPILAVFGAITWGLWVVAFYQLEWDFMLISVPAGFVAHGLAAGLYLQLIYRWYRLG
ncbi:MAG: hypothetical protein Q8M16_01265 [Pirellulaceae bacterium]|nr:hypothetical protein [Pirellulaceae bacterium]